MRYSVDTGRQDMFRRAACTRIDISAKWIESNGREESTVGQKGASHAVKRCRVSGSMLQMHCSIAMGMHVVTAAAT